MHLRDIGWSEEYLILYITVVRCVNIDEQKHTLSPGTVRWIRGSQRIDRCRDLMNIASKRHLKSLRTWGSPSGTFLEAEAILTAS